MAGRVIVLNGGSSSGKSTLARALQSALPDPWLTFGIDDLVDAMPRRMDGDGGVEIGPDGSVALGAEFGSLELAWTTGLSAMARGGADLILDEVFLGGAASQSKLALALTGLDVTWVGVRCDPLIATARERARGDRAIGMAAGQAESVHLGVTYDVEVDTGRDDIATCADTIAAHFRA
jgi:chloramphenicol 3-O phosphotransferase